MPLYGLGHRRQGIVHVIGPELGVTQPGMTIVCGDSHTSTHGAFGALAFGIGTSEVEHVLATQTLPQTPPADDADLVPGQPRRGLHGQGSDPGHDRARSAPTAPSGHAVEYHGEAIAALSMEGRMTVANMSIEAGARAGMIAPDDTTFAYMEGRPGVPADFAAAVERWRGLATRRRGERSTPRWLWTCRRWRRRSRGARTRARWRRSRAAVPEPADESDERALTYMDLRPGTPMSEIAVDRVFLGSCTNARIEDLRAAAEIVRGRRVASTVRAMVVPGSVMVKAQAEREGLDEVFKAAGFDWRGAGCSMCLGMNPDILAPGERCASTSNRNFEGRQGRGGRTHLLSPAMAAAAAVTGRLTDVRELV